MKERYVHLDIMDLKEMNIKKAVYHRVVKYEYLSDVKEKQQSQDEEQIFDDSHNSPSSACSFCHDFC